jgi:Domain of unknown function (DUF3598)
MEPQLENWQNFCRYHAVGNWHGTWTKYSPELEIIESFRGIRSFLLSEDGNTVYHQNHYFYNNFQSESQIFTIKHKPLILSLCLDNSFSWSSTKRESELDGEKFGFSYLEEWKWTPFFCEIGFRHENIKISAGAVYDVHSELQNITVINEYLGSFGEISAYPSMDELNHSWQGTLKTMTSDWIVSPPVTTSSQKLENINPDYLTLHTNVGVSISCPQAIEKGKEFFVAVDWLISPNLLQRGSRYFDASGFTKFTLEEF